MAGQGGDETDSHGIVFTPAAVAVRLGVAVATLRSWDRRHGLGPTGHRAGRHRRYTGRDVVRLERVVALLRQGVPVASAAAAVGGRAQRNRIGARELRQAADRLDLPCVQYLVATSLAELGTVETWQRLLVPLLDELGRVCVPRGGPVEVEHVVTAGILAALRAVAPGVPPALAPAPSVLLACAPDEQHSLPLEVLATALGERGVGCLTLGARVPAHALLAAAGAIRARHVVVWAHTSRLAGGVPVAELLSRGAAVVVAGPGWSGRPLSPAVHHPRSLTEAIDLVREPAPGVDVGVIRSP